MILSIAVTTGGVAEALVAPHAEATAASVSGLIIEDKTARASSMLLPMPAIVTVADIGLSLESVLMVTVDVCWTEAEKVVR